MADNETSKVPQRTIVVNEHVEYPTTRIVLGSGVIQENDKVTLNLTVKDNDGNVKYSEKVKTNFKDYPSGMYIVARAKLDFIETSDLYY